MTSPPSLGPVTLTGHLVRLEPLTHDHLPDALVGRRYYEPKEAGHEAAIRRWLAEREAKKEAQRSPKSTTKQVRK